MGLFQYIQDTRSELHHVAWPTRLQTIVYTVIVIVLSILVAFYLGFFDFIFTTGLARIVEVLPGANSVVVEQIATTTDSAATSTQQ